MKTSKRNKLLGLALTGSFSLFGASSAFAAANDSISNIATLGYSVGNVPQTVIESSEAGNSTPGVGAGTATAFVEDRIINFTVVRENGAAIPVAPGSSQQAIPYLIDNTGNGTHGFLLAGIHNSGASDPFGGAADSFTPTTIRTYVDTDGDGVLDPAEIVATNSYIPSFAPGAPTTPASGGLSTGVEIRVFVVSDIPLDEGGAPLATNDIAVMSLVAHAAGDGTNGTAGTAISIDDNGHFTTGGIFTNGNETVANASGSAVTNADDPTSMETVFGDDAFVDGVTGTTVDGTGAADIVSNAQASSYSSYIVQTAELTVTKTSQVIYDPINLSACAPPAPGCTTDGNPKAIPTAYIQYTITIANAVGASSANLTTLSDVINATGTSTVNLDPDLLRADIDLGATLVAGDFENGGGDAVRIDTTGTGRNGGTGTITYCLGTGAGCTYTTDPNGTVTVDFAAVAGMAVEAGYVAGELKAGESVDVVFNVVVQ